MNLQLNIPDANDRTCEQCGKVYHGTSAVSNLRRRIREGHQGKVFPCPPEGCDEVSHRIHNPRGHWKHKHMEQEMPDWLRAKRNVGGGGVKRSKTAAMSSSVKDEGQGLVFHPSVMSLSGK